jgi:hypothetical protein
MESKIDSSVASELPATGVAFRFAARKEALARQRRESGDSLDWGAISIELSKSRMSVVLAREVQWGSAGARFGMTTI